MTRTLSIPKSENPFFYHKLSRPRVIFGPKEKFEFEKKKIRAYSYITEICDGTGVRDPEVGKNPKNIF